MPACPACETAVDPETAICPSCGLPLLEEESTARLVSDGGEESQRRSRRTSTPDVDVRQLGRFGMAIGFALLPAFGVYVLASLVAAPELLLAVVALPLFALLIYGRGTTTRMTSATLLLLAVEAFVAPVVAYVYISSNVEASNDSALGTAIAGIQGGILLVLAFVVCIPLGIGFYLLSKRVKSGRTMKT